MKLKSFVAALAAFAALAAPHAARALDKVSFATNWLAEAEHGGFYQAVADGTYAKYGLEVKIVPGGPQANNRLLLISGKVDFFMGANMIQAMDAVKEGVPTLAVASMFQKDPIIYMSHPGQGLDKIEDLKNANAYFVGKDNLVTVFQWAKQTYGFREEKVKPYSFNPAPFLADKKSVQQGYLTSEPYEVEKQGGFKPNVFLVADYGYDSYSTTIETRADTIAKKPDLVQRFVDASAIGWYNYLYGDNKAANVLIKKDNPEITDGQIAFSIAKMKEYGIVDSGDSLKAGIGAMTDARMKSFFDKMVKAGVVDAKVDYKKSYTLQFVNKGVGVDLRPKP
ncbi:MAG: ABC transporter substrate-binding protein [Hyphomicrobiales bacterium]|nr:ABC transporter substrate-binding protein [Methylobacteriaceae bacterium]MCC2109392.1 ABC transporter substrate-binding protein [Hyphomicrobiales bacterium]